MSQAVTTQSSTPSLTGLLMPLSDRTLILPNVAVAELIPYRAPQVSEGAPNWFLGQITWRDLRLPLLSFEAASNGQVTTVSPGARVAVINALGGRPAVKFIAVLVQGIPRSIKVGAELVRADVELSPLELDAIQFGETVLKVPDLIGLEQKLADAGMI